jgi:hypothetical protein
MLQLPLRLLRKCGRQLGIAFGVGLSPAQPTFICVAEKRVKEQLIKSTTSHAAEIQ